MSAIAAPQPKTPNVLRWYNHIKSFTDKERSQFPVKKAEFSAASGDSAGPAAAADDGDDDDVDLFGSDEEEVESIPVVFILWIALNVHGSADRVGRARTRMTVLRQSLAMTVVFYC